MSAEQEALITEARDPDTSFERLVELVKHSEVEVRLALLDNPNLCPTDEKGKLNTDLLEDLAEEFPEEVANLLVFVLYALIEPNDAFEEVIREVVERTEDVSLIEHVFRTWEPSSGNVRQGVALNPKTPENILRMLGNPKTESEWWVRQGVAENPRAHEDTLRTLGNEATESQWNVRLTVAQNPNAPEDLLCLMGNEKTESNRWVREAVATNPNTPGDTLRTLGNQMTESFRNVRKAVVSNPGTPVDTLRTLGNEQTEVDDDVREAAKEMLAKRGLT